MSKLKCKRGEVIRIIAVQMNLPDRRGGELPPSPPPLNAALQSLVTIVLLCQQYYFVLHS